jgi:glycosyltransferase involved in cell wall biosynthesis
MKIRIAAFGGFRSIPPKAGGAGADKFALELYPRIVRRGHRVIAYCRIYPGDMEPAASQYDGVRIISFKTVRKAGFDTLLHSCKATLDIIMNNRADVVHINSGANSIWALLLRLAGKRVYVSQFAMDWKRAKWPWYAKAFYWLSKYLTASLPNGVIFDNIYTQRYFEDKFGKKFYFVPYGSEVPDPPGESSVLARLGLQRREYFLFVGRFIPDKGIHLLIEAFRRTATTKKLVLVGGSTNPSDYEKKLRRFADERILFPGFIYGDDVNALIRNAYICVQPSFIEGLSPVILTVMGLGTPLICSDIVENKYITRENALHFTSGNIESLREKLLYSLENYDELINMARLGAEDVLDRFNWEEVTDQYVEIFTKS